MNELKIIEEVPLSMFEIKNELKELRQKEKELNFRFEKTEEYVNSLIKYSEKEFKEMESQIKELNIQRIKEKEIVKILDILPKNEEEVKLILSANNITLKKEDAKKIADVINNVLSAS